MMVCCFKGVCLGDSAQSQEIVININLTVNYHFNTDLTVQIYAEGALEEQGGDSCKSSHGIQSDKEKKDKNKPTIKFCH